MRLFPRRHTPESVAAELIEGLENGTITLAPPPLDVSDAIAEAMKLAAEVKAAAARLIPDYSHPELLTAAELLSIEESSPGSVNEFLNKLTEARVALTRLEAERGRIFWTRLAFWVGVPVLTIGATTYFVYLCMTNPAAAILGGSFALVAIAAHAFQSKLSTPGRSLAEARAKLLTAANDFAAKSRSFAN